MLILAIDTSAVASAALVSDDAPEGVLASFSTEDTRSHAEVLAPGIDALLADAGVTGADIDAIVTGVGPGPFTGLRSGIATARTLAFVWDKPLYGLMSLDAMALEVAESTAAVPEFLVATDARRKEVYWARYSLADGQLPRLVDGPHVGFAADLPDLPGLRRRRRHLRGRRSRADPDFSSEQPDALYLGQFAAGQARRGGAAAGLHPAVPARIRRPGARAAEAGAVSDAGGRRPAPHGVVAARHDAGRTSPPCNALERRLFPVDAWPLQMFHDELAQTDTRRYLVAEAAGEIVGYAGLMCIEPIADVQTIAVVPECEGQGIGSALLTGSSRKPAGAARRTCCWRSARTTRGPSSCTGASGSNRSMSGRGTTATAWTP